MRGCPGWKITCVSEVYSKFKSTVKMFVLGLLSFVLLSARGYWLLDMGPWAKNQSSPNKHKCVGPWGWVGP